MQRSLTLTASALALMLTGSALLAAGLDATLGTATIAEGDTVQLQLSGDLAQLTATPDLSPLSKDFDVLGTQQSRQTRIVNSVRSDTLAWIVTLAPHGKGTITIPAIAAGSASSAPLTLIVVDAAQMPTGQTSVGPTIESSLPPGPIYQQQEIPLTLHITAPAGMQGGQIVPPESSDYILTQTGQDRSSQSTVNGRPVTVIERDYKLRPQKSGPVTVAPFTLQATVSDPTAGAGFGADPFAGMLQGTPFAGQMGGMFGQMFNPGREVVVRSAPLTLQVKAAPGAAGGGQTGWFLPAKAVTLTAEWQPEAPQFRVGEAVVRHVRILALGATPEQLPDLAISDVPGLRIYADANAAKSADTKDGTAALRDFSYSVVPTQGGTLTLPEVRLDWFNTATEQTETAILPAETITVAGTAAAPTVTQPEAASPGATTPSHPIDMRWAIGSVVGLAMLAALGVLVHRRKRRQAASAPGTVPSRAGQRAVALRNLARLIETGTPARAYPAALAWLKAADADLGATALVWQQSPDLLSLWQDMERQVFAQAGAGSWNGAALMQAIAKSDRQMTRSATARQTGHSRLGPLYPAGPLATRPVAHPA